MKIRESLTAFSLSLLVTQTADAQSQTGRFAHAQRTIVPSSKFSRHFDNESVSESNGGTSGTTGFIAPPPPVAADLNEMSAGQPQRGSWASPAVKTTARETSTLAKAKVRLQPLLAAGKYDTAQSLMKTYVRSFPDDKSLKQELANVAVLNSEHQLQQSLPQGAAAAARQALDAEPGNQPARNALSQALTKLGMDPGNAADRIKLADGLLADGRYSEAAVEYTESLRFRPSAEAHIGLGDAEWREGRKESAKTEYQHALEINPKSATALRQLGMVRFHEGDVVGANDALSKALILHPGDKVVSGKLIELWHSQVSRNPESANGHLGLARAYQLSGDLSSAQSEYRHVVRIDPNNPKLEQARKSFKIALAHQQAQHSFDNAHALEGQGMVKEAHQKSVEAVALNPLSVPMRLYQGHLSQRLGYNAEAHAAYMEVLKQDPRNDEAARALSSLPAIATAQETPLAPPLAAEIPASDRAMTPPLAPRVVPMQSVPVAPVAAAPAPAQPGSVVIPGETAGDPQALPGKPYSTSQHVNTMSTFLGQLRGLAQAAQPDSSGAGGALGGLSALAGGALGADAAASATPSLTGGPLDTGGASDALAQAAAALKAAGAGSTLSTAPAVAAAPAAAAAPAGAAASTSRSFSSFATQAFPNLAGKIDANKVMQLSKQYGPLIRGAATTMTPEQMDAMYAAYRPALEKQLGRKLPEKLPAGTMASAAAMTKQGAPPEVVAQQVITAAISTPTQGVSAAANAASAATARQMIAQELPPIAPSPQVFTSMTPVPVQISASPNLGEWNPAGVPLNVFDAEPPMVTPESIAPVAAAEKQQNNSPSKAATKSGSQASKSGAAVPKSGLNAFAAASTPNSSAVVTAVGGASALLSQLAPKTSAGAVPADLELHGPLGPLGTPPIGSAPLSSSASNVIAAAPLPGAEPLRDYMPPPPLGTTSAIAPLKLELLGVQPTSSEIRLQVRLRNTQSVAFKVPSGLKAVVQMNGKKQIAHVQFPANIVPAYGELQGIIKVSGHDLNPSADLWIPNVMPGTGADRNLHLSVNVPIAPM